MFDWTDIHENFGEYDGYYQKKWEEAGLTYQDVREWINTGFQPEDYKIVKSWIIHGFNAQETKEWRKFNSVKDNYQLASYLKNLRKLNPLVFKKNLIRFRMEYQNWKANPLVQEHLDVVYPPITRNQIIRLKINNQNLAGSLNLNVFPCLKELNCSNNKLTNLIINNSKLMEIDCSHNKSLTNLIFTNSPQLTRLNWSHCHLTNLWLNNNLNLKELICSNNQLTSLSFLNDLSMESLTSLDISHNQLKDLNLFSKLFNCESLNLSNNPFSGSLEPLQNLKQLKTLYIRNTKLNRDLEHLPENLEELYCDSELTKKLKDYEKNHSYDYQAWRKDFQDWKDQGFTKQQIYQWTDEGAKMSDHEFVSWLRDIKKYTPEWITNYQSDYQLLSERFKRYELCQECQQPNTGEQWCQSCNAPRLQKDFSQWTSHNPKINEFIKQYQLQATEANKFLEWIPYEKFVEIDYLAEGGFGKVYKANWIAGNIHHWDQENKQWRREKDNNKDHKTVVLKTLTNSQDNTDFLQETANHKIIDDWFNNIVPCYGISQDPDTGNYLMVMQYLPDGNLRNYLSKNNRELEKSSRKLKEKITQEKELNEEIKTLKNQLQEKEILEKKQQEFSDLHSEIVSLKEKLSLRDKFKQLVNISQGLKDIHQKKLVHHDFHSGNILKGMEKTSCLITDLGLCRPADETSQEKVFGVLPYVSPEVLQSKPYTQAADIYSFGIVTYELLTGLSPYYDRKHDVKLGIEICRGLRPKFNIKIPALLKDLINHCWDADHRQRPTSNELESTLRSWEQGNLAFKNQLKEAEEFNQTLTDEVRFPNHQTHQGAVYHSKLLPTKEITQLMQNFNLLNKTSELNTHLIQIKELANEITMKQKYQDFKKVLKLVLEKSEELETIIITNQLVISEEMKEVLTKIKELKNKSQEKDSLYQELASKKLAKEQELRDLKNAIINNNKIIGEDELGEVEELLEAQIDFLKNNNFKRLERAKKRLAKLIIEIEINSLCQLQTRITHLEIKLNKNVEKSTKQLTQIINNIGNISIQQGNAIIGNQIGDNPDLSMNKTIYSTTEGGFLNTGNFNIDGENNSINLGCIQQLEEVYPIQENNSKRPRRDSWEDKEKKRNKEDLTNIHPSFANQSLANQWTNQGFTFEQARDWINIGLTPDDAQFTRWLLNNNWTPEKALNQGNLEELKVQYQQSQTQAQIVQSSK